jgi:WD40 repeat protein
MAKEERHAKVSDRDLNCVRFETSGKTIITGGDDMSINLWSDELQLKKSLTGHEDAVLDVLFDYNNKYIISSGNDDTFRLWK